MSKPTKRITKTLKIHLQMTESRAESFENMLALFIDAAKLQAYPNEYINPLKGDYLELAKEVKNGKGRI